MSTEIIEIDVHELAEVGRDLQRIIGDVDGRGIKDLLNSDGRTVLKDGNKHVSRRGTGTLQPDLVKAVIQGYRNAHRGH